MKSCFLRMNKYRIIGQIGEGTFSEVMKTQSLRDGKYFACKKMKQRFYSTGQVDNLREIQALRRLSPHPNILQLHEVIFDKKTGSLALICELMDMNIYELIRGKRQLLPESKIKNYMYQLCKSLDHMHKNGIFHRDVKPENILIKQDILKLADFGSCRSVYSKQPYTEYISTRWYRAPECLLTDGYYSYKMDIWSLGCVFFEITSLNPLFPGVNELDQISIIHDILGTPDKRTLNKFKQSSAMSFNFPFKKGSGLSRLIPYATSDSLSLMYAMIEYDPGERITAKEALKHPYFGELRAAEKQSATLRHMNHLRENTGNSSSRDNLIRIAKLGRKQQHLKHIQEPLIRRQVPAFPVELPKLHVSGASTSYPTNSFQSIFPTIPHRGTLPILQTVKCTGKGGKPGSQQLKLPMKQYHLPSIEKKDREY
uniref:MOK protein kinase n=1 Tax=Latimeria chalumnae TaxID=7897 RepID=H3A4Z4_LATCH|nr:PREDICTED: MAPK/MAK/MRK overlapping kinase isoform X1 [Latimeria chalumnae]|eukprot:XP_006010475.1 PREDICTED: MAPK/MAK/MRK overlapping kinase isoform X1 [Latimeria chalumnae]